MRVLSFIDAVDRKEQQFFHLCFSLSLSLLAVIKTFIDRIIRRLQHFKRSLDNGLSKYRDFHFLINSSCDHIVHVRKRNTLMNNGPIISAEYRSQSETTRRKIETDQSTHNYQQEVTSWTPSSDVNEENKIVRPYFLIKPQSVLVLPNEIGKRRKKNKEK